MSSVNKSILLGRLGSDPDLRHTTEGDPVAKFSLATSQNKDSKPDWHQVVVWGKQAENCSKFLSKGSQVYVEGRIAYHQWTDDKGVKHNNTTIKAHKVTFVGSKSDEPKAETTTELSDDIPF